MLTLTPMSWSVLQQKDSCPLCCAAHLASAVRSPVCEGTLGSAGGCTVVEKVSHCYCCLPSWALYLRDTSKFSQFDKCITLSSTYIHVSNITSKTKMKGNYLLHTWSPNGGVLHISERPAFLSITLSVSLPVSVSISFPFSFTVSLPLSFAISLPVPFALPFSLPLSVFLPVPFPFTVSFALAFWRWGRALHLVYVRGANCKKKRKILEK